MTEAELEGMKQYASTILKELTDKQRVAKRKAEMDKLIDMFDKAYEADAKERDTRIAERFRNDEFSKVHCWAASIDSKTPGVFDRVPEEKAFSFSGFRARKDAQSIINTMLSDIAAKATCAPKEKTCSKNYIMQLFDKVDEARSAAEEAILDNFMNIWEREIDKLEPEPVQPKEKTYSQAYMDRMQKANQSLGEEIGHLNLENIKMQRCLEASGEILENTTDELKESQAENELLRATVQSLLNGKDNTDEACEAPEADRERELV